MIDPVSARDARAALLNKGYVLSEKGNRDHEMYFFEIDGVRTAIFFKISRGVREIRRDEIRLSARSSGILGDDLHSILSCKHDKERTRELVEAALEARKAR